MYYVKMQRPRKYLSATHSSRKTSRNYLLRVAWLSIVVELSGFREKNNRSDKDLYVKWRAEILHPLESKLGSFKAPCARARAYTHTHTDRPQVYIYNFSLVFDVLNLHSNSPVCFPRPRTVLINMLFYSTDRYDITAGRHGFFYRF